MKKCCMVYSNETPKWVLKKISRNKRRKRETSKRLNSVQVNLKQSERKRERESEWVSERERERLKKLKFSVERKSGLDWFYRFNFVAIINTWEWLNMLLQYQKRLGETSKIFQSSIFSAVISGDGIVIKLIKRRIVFQDCYDY